jgi:ferredoxin, 2Fe-2S
MKATWILPDGREISADVAAGRNLMEAAVAASVPGVIGECGGSMSCATCHVYVGDNWVMKTGMISAFEDAMLDVAEGERLAKSRLSCQIRMAAELDGLILRVPLV